MSANMQPSCTYCGLAGHNGLCCPRIKAVEFDTDGLIKRVEFMTPTDYPAYQVTSGIGQPFATYEEIDLALKRDLGRKY